jgi:hypothetical protein
MVDLLRAQLATELANGEALGPANNDNGAGGTEGAVVWRRREVVERLRAVPFVDGVRTICLRPSAETRFQMQVLGGGV